MREKLPLTQQSDCVWASTSISIVMMMATLENCNAETTELKYVQKDIYEVN